MPDSFDYENFDPNDPQTTYGWLVVTSTGQMRMHPKRAPALNSILSWHRARLYEMVPRVGWVLRAEKTADYGPCEDCTGPADAGRYSRSPWYWRRKNRKITSPPQLVVLCPVCADRNYHA